MLMAVSCLSPVSTHTLMLALRRVAMLSGTSCRKRGKRRKHRSYPTTFRASYISWSHATSAGHMPPQLATCHISWQHATSAGHILTIQSVAKRRADIHQVSLTFCSLSSIAVAPSKWRSCVCVCVCVWGREGGWVGGGEDKG